MSSADSQEVPPDALKSRKKSFRMILDDHIAERDWDSLSILHDLAKEDEATADGEANAATTGGGHVDDDSPIAKAANANLERLQILAETARHAESGSSGPGTPRGEGESAVNKKGRSVEVISSSEDEREEREEMNSNILCKNVLTSELSCRFAIAGALVMRIPMRGSFQSCCGICNAVNTTGRWL